MTTKRVEKVSMRLAGDSAKALPKRFKFTGKSLASLRLPAKPDGRLWVYDTDCKGLAFLLTGKGGKSFYLYRRVGGRPERVRLGGAELTVEQARDAVARLNGEIVSGVNPAEERRLNRVAGTLVELWERYKAEHLQTRCSARTVETDESRWDTCLSGWAQRSIKAINESDIRSLHDSIGLKRGHVTANRTIQLLRRMFNFARLVPNPASRGCVTMFRENERTRFLSPDEMKNLLAALDDVDINPDIADIIRLSLFTGARRGNCQSAKVSEFDLSQMTWTIPPAKSKNAETMTLVLVEQAAEVVRRRIGHESGYLFPSFGKLGHIVETYSTWERVLQKAGLTDVHFHDLRRSYASWMAGLGAPLLTISKALGHRNISATTIYARLDLSAVRVHAAAAVDAMTKAGAK
jgi:integrase